MSTQVIASTAALGPSNTAVSTPPMRWPDVPPATGKLIICAAKTKAEARPSSGIWRGSNEVRTCRKATPTPAAATPAESRAVRASRNPSGRCM